MKNLKTQLLESMNINESIAKILAIIDHYNPHTIHLVVNYSPKSLKCAKDADMEVFELTADQNICHLAWNDEDAYIDGLATNLAQCKKYIIQNAKNSIERYEGDDNKEVGEVDYGFIDIYSEVIRKDYFKDIWGEFVDFIETSEVNGDSEYGRAIIDIKKQMCIISGDSVEVNFISDSEVEKLCR